MDDTKATEHLLRRMNGVTGDRDPPEILGTELRLGESQFTLKTIIKVLGISGRHVRRLYRGKVSFEKTRKIQLEDKARMMEKNLSMKLWTRSRMYKIVNMRKNQ
jgi:hypothetical protein